MNFQRNLPGCCSVGILYNLHGEAPTITRSGGYPVVPNACASGAFIAIFTKHQKKAFDKVCAKNTLLSAVRHPGSHGTDLAICVFKGGKK